MLAVWHRDSFQRQSWLARWAILTTLRETLASQARGQVRDFDEMILAAQYLPDMAPEHQSVQQTVRQIAQVRRETMTEYRVMADALIDHSRRYQRPYRRYGLLG